MIALKSVQETHPRVPVGSIDQLIDLRHGVLWACLVQIREIYTNPLFAILFPDYHRIHQPLREEGFLYHPDLF